MWGTHFLTFAFFAVLLEFSKKKERKEIFAPSHELKHISYVLFREFLGFRSCIWVFNSYWVYFIFYLYDKRWISIFTFLNVHPSFPSIAHMEKPPPLSLALMMKASPPLVHVFSASFEDQVAVDIWTYFLVLCSVTLAYESIYMLMPCCLVFYSVVVYLEIR